MGIFFLVSLRVGGEEGVDCPNARKSDTDMLSRDRYKGMGASGGLFKHLQQIPRTAMTHGHADSAWSTAITDRTRKELCAGLLLGSDADDAAGVLNFGVLCEGAACTCRAVHNAMLLCSDAERVPDAIRDPEEARCPMRPNVQSWLIDDTLHTVDHYTSKYCY